MTEDPKYVELSLKVGCKNACEYCPQGVYLKAYKGDIKELTLEDFKKMLENIPKTYTLQIAGKSEPFLNKDFPDMLIYAHSVGYKINVFTTLVGFTEEIADKLNKSDLILNIAHFHIYKSKSMNPKDFAKSRTLFLKKVKCVFAETSMVSNPFSIASHCFEIKPYKGKMESVCYRAYNNSIDVNGDIYLCCMDWSLKYKLGNIYESSIDSEEVNFKRMECIDKMQSDDDFICKHCEWFEEKNRR